jgi:hypothetical protein
VKRHAVHWQHKPGGYDALNLSRLFPSHNPYGIPALSHVPLARIPETLVPYRQRVSSQEGLDDCAVHFFLDDYRFESVWNKPDGALSVFGPYPTVLTPDFSLSRSWPLAVQVWNTYRSRWCGCYWQMHGLMVIPTVSWSDQHSFAFCFAGIPQHSVVAVSTVGVDMADPLTYGLFMAGFTAMVETLSPSKVLCYGRSPDACRDLADVRDYKTRWQNIRRARREAREQREAGCHGW